MNHLLAGIFGLQGPELLVIGVLLLVPLAIIFIIVKAVSGRGPKDPQ